MEKNLNEEITFPNISEAENINRADFISKASLELKGVLPDGAVLGDIGVWKLWEELTAANLEIGALQVVWIETKHLDKELRVYLKENKCRFAFIKQSLVLSGSPGNVFDEVYAKMILSAVNISSLHNEEKPIIQWIYPTNKWNTVLKWGGKANLGVDTNGQLILSADTKIVDNLDLFSVQPNYEASLKVKSSQSMHFIVPPFEYSIRRPQVKAQGKGGHIGLWYFGKGPSQTTDSGYLDEKEIVMGLMVLVPEDVCLDLEVMIVARHHFDFSIPNMSSLVDSIYFLSKSLRDFVIGGLPLAKHTKNGKPLSQKASCFKAPQ